MEIQTRTRCRKCHGTGKTKNPAWLDYVRNGKGEPAFDFFRSHHYSAPSLEPKDIECRNCDGTGYVFKWVPLNELFKMSIPHEIMKAEMESHRSEQKMIH